VKQLYYIWSLIAITTIFSCCTDPVNIEEESLEDIPFQPTLYKPQLPSYFPAINNTSSNPLTEEGITLGRSLFFDPILSKDKKMSCSSCHLPEKGFTDGRATSPGVDGIFGKRSSMSLVNIAFTKNGLFWDGRSPSLEDQALQPVEDPIELHTSWGEVIGELKKDKEYPVLFRKAFGIKSKEEITKQQAANALAQYQRILLSVNSKYDRVKQGLDFFTDLELAGFSLYTDVPGDDLTDAECHHCHQLDLATSDAFFNNGLQSSPTINDFQDKGKGGVTGNILENGKFRAPTLRNIFLSAPYMHNGKFKTMDEVLDHYNSGGKYSPNKDPLIRDLKLSPFEKKALLAFLQTLTDTSYLSNPMVMPK
jgi:cytochrome c peroxidase